MEELLERLAAAAAAQSNPINKAWEQTIKMGLVNLATIAETNPEVKAAYEFAFTHSVDKGMRDIKFQADEATTEKPENKEAIDMMVEKMVILVDGIKTALVPNSYKVYDQDEKLDLLLEYKAYKENVPV